MGFQCFANYTPHRKGQKKIVHSNRTVIHPDYQGYGLGIKLINLTSEYMLKNYGYRVMAKFTSTPVYKAMKKQPEWQYINTVLQEGAMSKGGNMKRGGGFREYGTKSYIFEYFGQSIENQQQKDQHTP